MKNPNGKRWIGSKAKGGYVSPEEAEAHRKAQEALVKELCEEHTEISRSHLTATGLDISVARRLLADLRKRGVVQTRIGQPAGTMYYRWNPRGLMGLSWVKTHNSTPLGQHECRL